MYVEILALSLSLSLSLSLPLSLFNVCSNCLLPRTREYNRYFFLDIGCERERERESVPHAHDGHPSIYIYTLNVSIAVKEILWYIIPLSRDIL